MIRTFLAFAVVSLTACSARYDVPVAWTIDGFPAADACQQLTSPKVSFHLEQRDSTDGADLEETQETTDCGAGTFAVKSAAFSRIFVDLLEGDVVYGSAGPFNAAPGASGYDAAAPIRADIELQRGRVQARLTVVGEDCGAAGASSFTVTLSRETAPLAQETVVEEDVACGTDGTAFFAYEPVEIGSRYNIFASTTVGTDDFATDDLGSGEGFTPARALTDVVADLDVIGRPTE